MFANHLACQHSQWPPRYHSIAAPLLRSIVLPDTDVQMMLDKGTCVPVFHALQTLTFGSDGVLPKLAGFSFRGHPAYDLPGGQVKTKDDLGLLCSSLPGRVRWAMHNCLKVGESVQLDVFRWRSVPAETEIRLDVRDRKLTQVQRYHDMRLPPDAGQIRMAADVFDWMLPDLPLDNCLIDLTTQYNSAPLIELNPLPMPSE